MNQEQREAIEKVVHQLWAHDPWMWGNSCAKMLEEIDWDEPAIVEHDGDYTTTRFIMNKREFELSYQEGGYYMGYVLPCNLRLTGRVPDA